MNIKEVETNELSLAGMMYLVFLTLGQMTRWVIMGFCGGLGFGLSYALLKCLGVI